MNKAITTIIAIIVMFVATGCGSTLTQNRIKDSQTSIMHAAPYSGPEPPPPICDKQREKAMEYLTWFTPPSEPIQESKGQLQSDLNEEFKEIGKALGSCQNLSPFNEAANLLNGQAHAYRYLYHGRSHSDLVVARLSFEQALRNNPGNRVALFWLSFIQHELGWDEKAQKSLKRTGSVNLSWDSVERIIRNKMPVVDKEFSTWVDSELKRIANFSKEPIKKPASVSKKKTAKLTPIKKSASSKKKQSPPKKKLEKKTAKPQKKKPYNQQHIFDKAPSVNELEKNYQKWLNSKR